MSNHSGSYMLNSLLSMPERESYFVAVGPERTAEFISDVLGLAMDHDGNPGEVLHGIGERLGICYRRGRRSDEIHGGRCPSCNRPAKRPASSTPSRDAR